MVQPILGTDSGRKPLVAEAVPFSPSQITTSAWYDAGNAPSVNHTSNAVNTLNDLSGNARHISNTSTGRPTYDSTNAKIVFNGTTNLLYNSSPFMWGMDEKVILLVANVTTGANKRYVGESSASTSARYFPLQTGNSGGQQTDICPLVTTDANASALINRNTQTGSLGGSKQIIRVHDHLGLVMTWLNGANCYRMRSYERQSLTLTPNRFCLGGSLGSGGAGNLSAMDFYEMIVLPNTTYAEEVEGYLAHKHGLTGSLPASHPYKTNAPLQGATTNYGPPNLTALPHIRGATMGDSLTAQNSYNLVNAMGWATCGNHNWYRLLSNDRIYIPNGNNNGVSGNTLLQMTSRMVADLGADTFDVCFLMGGTNQLAATTVSDRHLQLDELMSYITLELGKICVVMTITPVVDSDLDGAEVPLIAEANAFIMRHHGFCMGRIIAVDVAADLEDTGGNPLPDMLFDTVHYSPLGSYYIGRKLDEVLEPYFGRAPVPNWNTGNLLTNGSLSGTGGTGTGAIATNWTFADAEPGTPTVTKDGTGYQNITNSYTATGADSSNTWEFYQNVTSGFASGDVLYAQALVEVDDATNMSGLSLNVYGTPTGAQTIHTVRGAVPNQGPMPQYYGVDVGQYLITTQDFVLTSSGFTNLKVQLLSQNRTTGIATSNNITIKGIGLFKR